MFSKSWTAGKKNNLSWEFKESDRPRFQKPQLLLNDSVNYRLQVARESAIPIDSFSGRIDYFQKLQNFRKVFDKKQIICNDKEKNVDEAMDSSESPTLTVNKCEDSEFDGLQTQFSFATVVTPDIPTSGLISDNGAFPSKHDENKPAFELREQTKMDLENNLIQCICSRQIKSSFCLKCKTSFNGRVYQECGQHPKMAYKNDNFRCPHCKADMDNLIEIVN